MERLDSLKIALGEITVKKVVSWIVTALGMAVGLYILGKLLTALSGAFVTENALLLVRWKDTVRRFGFACIVSTLGFLAAVLHLYIFDRRFLGLSRLEKVKQKSN